MKQTDLREALALVREKDPAGFEALYRDHFRFLFGVAYAVLGSEEDSCDVIQSVMLRLYLLSEDLFPREHEAAWLKTVVKNEALMKLRREKPTDPLGEAAEIPAFDRKIEDFVDMDAFRTLTEPLGERQKEVVSLRILGDLTHREIAQLLSIPIGTVQWLYATSIRQLRRALTTLGVLALVFAGGFGYALQQHFRAPAEAPGDFGISSLPPAAPSASPWLAVFSALLLATILIGAMIFIFSDKIPTKRLTKRIH